MEGIVADLSSLRGANHLCDEVLRRTDRLDCLLNNAGKRRYIFYSCTAWKVALVHWSEPGWLHVTIYIVQQDGCLRGGDSSLQMDHPPPITLCSQGPVLLLRHRTQPLPLNGTTLYIFLPPPFFSLLRCVHRSLTLSLGQAFSRLTFGIATTDWSTPLQVKGCVPRGKCVHRNIERADVPSRCYHLAHMALVFIQPCANNFLNFRARTSPNIPTLGFDSRISLATIAHLSRATIVKALCDFPF